MSAIGDFISFQFGSYHSSDLGIVHVSESDRYNEDLAPQISDKTLQRPGSDGTYFFGSFYTQKQFTLSFAFDDVTELQYRDIGRCFNTKTPVWFWTDERPYKKYLVKSSSPVQMKAICFDERNEDDVPVRHYKGEGAISLITYEPYARSRYKYLSFYHDYSTLEEDCWEATTITGNRIQKYKRDKYYSNRYYFKTSTGGSQYTPSILEPTIKYDNVDEWGASSGLLDSNIVSGITYDIFSKYTDSNLKAYTYNAGDMEADCSIKLKFNDGILLPTNPKIARNYWTGEDGSRVKVESGSSYDFSKEYFENETGGTALEITQIDFKSDILNIFIEQEDITYGQIKLTLPIVAKGDDTYIEINSKYNLIRGLQTKDISSDYIYDEYKTAGNFFKLNTDESIITINNLYFNNNLPLIDYDIFYY